MKNKTFLLTIHLLAMLCGVRAVRAQTSGTQDVARVTYQGYLTDAGQPANGRYDFRFTVYDSGTNGSPVPGGAFEAREVPVASGLFTVELKFALDVYIEETSKWLQKEVRQVPIRDYVVLLPREPLLPTPFALRARDAANAQQAANVADGAIGNASLQNASVTGMKIADGNVVRSLNGLREDVSFAVEEGLLLKTAGSQIVLATAPLSCSTYSSCYWALLGNAGTVDGVNFLGTTDPVPLDLRVNNLRVMRYEYPPATSSPNLIGGNAANTIGAVAVGATIGGGGSFGAPNNIAANFATIGGGKANTIQAGARYSTISGGTSNTIQAASSFGTIGGGSNNLIQTISPYSTISGGSGNSIQTNSLYCAIGGGTGNAIEPSASRSTIGGGERNLIGTNAVSSTIGGGSNNLILTTAPFGTIGGGSGNIIEPSASQSSIGGGVLNRVQMASTSATIAGGTANTIHTNAANSTIGGGANNRVRPDAHNSTIAGGNSNVIQDSANFSTVGGGTANNIYPDATHGTIGGGKENTIRNGSRYSVISGGNANTISTNSPSSTVSGGSANTIEVDNIASTVGGGYGNRIQVAANYSTVGGGSENLIEKQTLYATIPGGYRAWATNYGQLAYASGQFAAKGDAQTSLYVVRRQTSDGSTNELFLDGVGQRMKVVAGSTWSFDALISARGPTGSSAGYHICGVIENVGGATTLIATPTTAWTKEDVAGWNAFVEADDLNDALVIKVSGAGATNIRWVASVRTTEVMFP